MRTTTRAADYAWGFLAGLMAVLTTLNTVACLFAVVVGGNAVGLLRLPAGLLFGYWMGMGAWRRTRWGAAPEHGVDAGPPLSAAHVRASSSSPSVRRSPLPWPWRSKRSRPGPDPATRVAAQGNG